MLIKMILLIKICREKEEGGLEIKNLKAFNLALVEKWLWRMRNEKESFWTKVLSSKCGDPIVNLNSNASKGLEWWRDVQNVEKCIWGFIVDWFSKELVRKVSNRENTILWLDPWHEGKLLKNSLPYLVCIAQNKFITL